MKGENKITIAIPAEDVEYVESLRIYNVKVSMQFFRNTILEEIKEHIDFLSEHCENKKAQNMCSACIVLGDLKIKINPPIKI